MKRWYVEMQGKRNGRWNRQFSGGGLQMQADGMGCNHQVWTGAGEVQCPVNQSVGGGGRKLGIFPYCWAWHSLTRSPQRA